MEFEGFAQEEDGLQPHTAKLPVIFAGDYDNWRVARAVVAAQDFVESGTVKVGQANIEEDEMRTQAGNDPAGLLPVGEEGKLPVPVHFERGLQQFSDIGVVFDNGYKPGRRAIILKRVCLQEFVSHVHGPSTDQAAGKVSQVRYKDAHKFPTAHTDPPASATCQIANRHQSMAVAAHRIYQLVNGVNG